MLQRSGGMSIDLSRRPRSHRSPSPIRRLGAAAAALVLGLWLAGMAGGAGDEDRGTIRITDAGLVPEEFHLARGEVPSWSNAQEHPVFLSFPGELADALSCDGDGDPEPQLHPDGRGRLLSNPIRSLPYALPCPLPPGVHAYRALLVRQKGPPGAPLPTPRAIVNPETLEGRIVVD